MVKKILFEYEKNIKYDESNKGSSWTDEELKMILSFAPTKENALKLSKTFKRGYGSIEQIFRWASTSADDIKKKGRENDGFIIQIKKVAKELGWRV